MTETGNTMGEPGFDLIVLTWNEEVNLGYCLSSVRGVARNLFVVDSGSTDRTVEIARQYGAQVFTHPFVNQAEQLNWALDNLPIQSEWVLRLDADEYLSPELREELPAALTAAPAEITGFYLKYRMIFLERWIRHGGYYPVWILRLFRYGKARCDRREMDEKMTLLEGSSGRLRADFIHHDRKGLSAWTIKHEKYAARQARTLLLAAQAKREDDAIEPRLFGNQAERKRWLKQHLYGRVPPFLRAFLFFVYRYFFRLGLLDGVPGLIFHFLHAGWYMFYVDSILYESRLNEQTPAEAQVEVRQHTI